MNSRYCLIKLKFQINVVFSTHYLGRRIFSPGVLEQLICEVVMVNVVKHSLFFPFGWETWWQVQKFGHKWYINAHKWLIICGKW